MKQWISILALLVTPFYAAQVEVTAEKFFADEKKKISTFEGNVVVIKESDKLTANKVLIEFDDKKQPLRYIALGNAHVAMLMNGKKYIGEAEKMTYEPNQSTYVLEKKAFLHEIETDKKVYGDYIKADQISGQYEVDGKGKAPVKFIFKVEDQKK
jgi:lipopolysaccharide export system protein LptA